MARGVRAYAARQQSLLWVAVVALALSLVGMHQLSVSHNATDPTANAPVSATSLAHVPHADAAMETPSRSHAEICPGCGEHPAVAMTCLVALILLAVGLVLRGPPEWRGVRAPRLVLLPPPPTWRWARPALTLAELSVSRT